MDYLLAIDIGTTNCKAVTFNSNIQPVHSIKNGYETFTDEE
jgi:sugar (pentulose or hexulose) kinase